MSMDLEEQYDRIYRYCYYRTGHVQLAEDMTQEAFLRYFEHTGGKISGRPLAYLYTVAGNLCIDEFRKKKAEGLLQEQAAADPSDLLVDTMDLKQALLALTDRETELVLLRYVNDVPVADLAKIYDVSRFALYRELKRALKKLERRISDEKDIKK